MQKKLNVAVLMGGRSSEHEVSLNSGTEIIKALDKNKYNVKPIKITKDGRWLVPPGFLELPEKTDLKNIESTVHSIEPLDPEQALDKAHSEKIDVVFLALHGQFGEDGSMQGLLEMAGLPYTGSGVLASALAMDKEKANEVYAYNGLNVPRFKVFQKGSLSDTDIQNAITKEFKVPFVTKPVNSGSSVGVTIVKNLNQLEKAIKDVWQESDGLMVQEFIAGDEVTCSVLEHNGKNIALPPTLITAQAGEFYDYRSKYASGGSVHKVPAPYTQDLNQKIQEVALKAHVALECRGMSRTDMILKNNDVYILETNTLPGFTSTSLLPEAAKAAGISYTELLDILIQNALSKARK